MLERRGIVLSARDLSAPWREWIAEAGLNVLGLHDSMDRLIGFAQSDDGKDLLAWAAAAGYSASRYRAFPGNFFACAGGDPWGHSLALP